MWVRRGHQGWASTQDGRPGRKEINGLAVGVRVGLRIEGDQRSGSGGGCARHLPTRQMVREITQPTARFIAAFIASRYDPAIKAFRARLQSAGKPPKLVLTACARKLLTTLNAMLRDGKDYRKQHA